MVWMLYSYTVHTSANEENSEKSQEKNWHPGPSPTVHGGVCYNIDNNSSKIWWNMIWRWSALMFVDNGNWTNLWVLDFGDGYRVRKRSRKTKPGKWSSKKWEAANLRGCLTSVACQCLVAFLTTSGRPDLTSHSLHIIILFLKHLKQRPAWSRFKDALQTWTEYGSGGQ